MGLFGYATLHRLVVRVHAGVIVNLECAGLQGCCDLHVDLVSAGNGMGRDL